MFREFFRRFTDRFNSKIPSNIVAKDRLQFVLIHDRTHIDPTTLEALKLDLIQVFSAYFDVDKNALEIRVQRHKSTSVVVVNLPFQRSKPASEREQRKTDSHRQKKIINVNEINTNYFFCPNEECSNYGKRGPDNHIVRSGFYGKGSERTQRLKCLVCGKRFSTRRKGALLLTEQ